MRLAEHVAGTVHVDAMLESMTPQQFDEWCAKDRIEPIGYVSQMVGLIGYMLASYMAEEEVDANLYMPWMKHLEATVDNRGAKQLMKSIFGPPTSEQAT